MRDYYQALDAIQKEGIIELGKSVQTSKNKELKTPKHPKYSSHRKNLHFDNGTASEIRIAARLSERELAETLGQDIPLFAHQQIRSYEKGKTKPSNPPRGMVSTKYMLWLKEKGYNPFNI